MTNAEKIYDALMRLPYVAFQSFFLVREVSGIRTLIAFHPYAGGDWPFVMTIAARVSVVIFITVLLSFYVSRFRPISKYSSWNPKITALLGTLFTYLLLLTPRAPADAFWDSLSTLLVLIGSTTAILVVVDLGRSLSIMPEARKLVTSGLYRRIRHPLYFAEEIAIIGFYLQFRSWQTLPILVIHFYFQIRRMDWEEGILAKAFPEYAGYKQRTYRLFPRLY
jgi:protein-S-isoprenylcysteine O-methyltransferase Ste14